MIGCNFTTVLARINWVPLMAILRMNELMFIFSNIVSERTILWDSWKTVGKWHGIVVSMMAWVKDFYW